MNKASYFILTEGVLLIIVAIFYFQTFDNFLKSLKGFLMPLCWPKRLRWAFYLGRRFVYLNRMLSKTKIIVLFVALFITHSAFAQSIPRYTALVGRKGSGAIKKGELLAQQGVAGIRRINNIHWEHITVDSFDIIVLRDTSQILFFRNKGNKFDEALRTQLKGLIINDRVLIFDIYAKGYPGVSVYLNPLEFKIE